MPQPQGPRLIVAMDYPEAESCLTMARCLDPKLCRLKVGKEMFTRSGPQLVKDLQALGFDIFLDLKFHDIPNTVAGAVKAAAELGVWMVNVHASGGERMMRAAREALDSVTGPKPLLVGVTVLTSMTEEELRSSGVEREPLAQVLHLAEQSHQAGLDGVVCSAQEAAALREHLGPDFCLVTPGIRPETRGIRPEASADDDQRRTLTPREAIVAGSHYLVIGRPITQASDPVAACRAINASLENLA